MAPTATEVTDATPAITANTLRFPSPLYKSIRELCETRQQTIREFFRKSLKAEIDRAKRAGEVGGELYEGIVGVDEYDLRATAERPWSSLGTTQTKGGRMVAYTFWYTSRFWAQIKGLTLTRVDTEGKRVTIRQLAIDVLTREVDKALAVQAGRGRS